MSRPAAQHSHTTAEARFAHLESSISSVAIQLGDFIKESKEYRERIEQDQSRIWTAIEKQGSSLQQAVERLSARGQISWPLIMSTVSVIVVLVSAGATVNFKLTESRIQQLEVREDSMEKLHDAGMDKLELKTELMSKRIDETHEDIKRMLLKDAE